MLRTPAFHKYRLSVADSAPHSSILAPCAQINLHQRPPLLATRCSLRSRAFFSARRALGAASGAMRGTCLAPRGADPTLPAAAIPPLAAPSSTDSRAPPLINCPRGPTALHCSPPSEKRDRNAKAANELVPKRRAHMRRLLLTSGGVSRASRHVEARCLFSRAARIVKYACAPLGGRAEAPLEVNRPGS